MPSPASTPDVDRPDRPADDLSLRALQRDCLPALIPLAVLAAMALSWRWTHDDGFITFRVVDQIFAGNGPVFNEGERVEAFTSPMHVALLVVLRGLFGWALDIAWLSLLLTTSAMVLGGWWGCVGAARLVRAGGARGPLVPFTVFVFAGLAPMWEYATSGLETGLVVGWVGGVFALLAFAATAPEALGRRRVIAIAVVVGLGPLVRPELAVASVALVVLVCTFPTTRAVPWWGIVAAAAALPAAYQLWRMGYYGTVVSNTALAKEAGGSRWDQGWYYLRNFAGPYLLVVPAALVVGWLVLCRRRTMTRLFGGRDGRNLVAVLVGVAAVLTGYVVRVGGDYMHARMLLVPTAMACLPFSMIPLPKRQDRRRWAIGLAGAFGCWAAWAALGARAPVPEGFFGSAAIADQRDFYREFARADHPVTLEDWARSPSVRIGHQARDVAVAGGDRLITAVGFTDVGLPLEQALPAGSGSFLYVDGIGAAGLAAGPEVTMLDYHGLAHPLASRMPPIEPRTVPGHEKALPPAWAQAEAGMVATSDPGVSAAAKARRCGDAARVLEATDGSLTVGRFLSNLVGAPALTMVGIDEDPVAALQSCPRG